MDKEIIRVESNIGWTLWLIGILFTLGLVLSIDNTLFRGGFWDTFKEVMLLGFGWPIVLGFFVGQLILGLGLKFPIP